MPRPFEPAAEARSRSKEARTGRPVCALGIFARAPLPGRTKTRLRPLLGAVDAARFHEACLQDTLELARALPQFAPILFLTPIAAAKQVQRRLEISVPIVPQGGGSLGRRMARALAFCLARPKVSSALLIGSDSPDLPARMLLLAERKLRRHPAVLAPARDGGFVLIGVRRAALGSARTRGRRLQEALEDIPWSTPSTLALTVERMTKAELPPALLPPWWDVDDPEGLRLLAQRLRAARKPGSASPSHVVRFLQSVGALRPGP